MPICPSCHRPVAVARRSCLYCAAELPPETLAASDAGPASPAFAPVGENPPASRASSSEGRVLVILDLEQADPAIVARVLGLPPFEAQQRVRRGGYQLHRASEAAEASLETQRLTEGGLKTLLLPEAEARVAAEPLMVLGGGAAEEGVALRTKDGLRRVRSSDLLLVVKGPIAREYQIAPQRKRGRTGRLDGGYRIHLHCLPPGPPLELDPARFAFDDRAGRPSSSLLRLLSWTSDLARGAPLDDGFRKEAPALGPAGEEVEGLFASGALWRARHRSMREAPTILDNLRQFRFYSGWRAAVERRRRLSSR